MNNPTHERGTTLRGTAHLWKREQGRYGDFLTSKCGAICTTDNGVDPYMNGDKVCRRCFPSGEAVIPLTAKSFQEDK